MANDPMGPFEIPAEMRKMAEQSVEQARKAFDGFMNAAQQTTDTLEKKAEAARENAKGMAGKAITFAEQNVAASFEFAQKLTKARDAQEVMRLQTEYLQSQMRTLGEQAKELGQTAGKAAMDTAKPKF